jgi:transcriptional regulator with XRE-family HTH domain
MYEQVFVLAYLFQTNFDFVEKQNMKSKLPEVLKRILKERSMSQRQLASASGVAIASINGMLTGKKSYSTDNLIAVSNALGVSLDTLLKDEAPSGFTADSISSTIVLDGIYRVILSKLDLHPKERK